MTKTSPMASRRRWLGALIGAAAFGAPVPAAAAQGPAVTYIETPRSVSALAAGPDGGMWAILPASERTSPTAVRYDVSGAVVATTPLRTASRPLGSVMSDLLPLPDGGVGAVVAHANSLDGPFHDVALARLAPRSGRARFTTLPREAHGARHFAIAADGALWFARPCRAAAYRLGTDGRLLRAALPQRRCSAGDREHDAALAVDAEGAAWVSTGGTNPRVVRVRPDGAVRSWRLPGRPTLSTTALAAHPRAAEVALQSAGSATYDARLRASERPVQVSGGAAPMFPVVEVDDSGTMWFGRSGDDAARLEPGLRQQTRAGRVRDVALGSQRDPAAIEIGRDGAPWVLAGNYDPGMSGFEGHYDDLHVMRIGGQPTAVALERTSTPDSERPILALAPDGALWAPMLRRVGTSYQWNWSVARVSPQAGGAPRAPRAAAVRVTLRRGATAWLQLGCRAERGRFCRGTARLGGGPAVRYVVAGQARGTVPVALDARVRRGLRSRRAVRVAARVTSVGARSARTTVTVRR